MDITRSGAERFHGIRTIVSGLSFKITSQRSWENNVSWDARTKQLVIRAPRVPNADGTTHHNYSIRLTLDDISSLISLLGHAGSASDAKLLRDRLSKHIPAIVKLLACATGVAPVPLREEQAPDAAGNLVENVDVNLQEVFHGDKEQLAWARKFHTRKFKSYI
jgi:hypothetical protein